MSEYQYYEFRALDAPLSAADRKHLRSISSRAEITSTTLTNEYEWGDFKGDPLALMRRCFDLHVYWANWGTRRLMLKVPAAALDGLPLDAYAAGPGLTVDQADGHAVVAFERAPEDGYDEAFDLYDRPWADDLLAVRDLLLAGDARPLYLGWLAGLADDADPEQEEPPVPPGLKDLPEPLRALVDYLGVDQDLLTLAAERSPAAATSGGGAVAAGAADLAAAVPDLPAHQKDAVLLLLLDGQAANARAGLTALLRRQASGDGGDGGGRLSAGVVTGRTVDVMLKVAAAVGDVRRRDEAERKRAEAERKAKKAAAARAVRLKELATRYDAAWAQVEPLIRSGSNWYPDAVRLLEDLRDAAPLAGKQKAFADRLRAVRAAFSRKHGLMGRLRQAGLGPDREPSG